MSIGELIAIVKTCFLLAPAFFLLGIGLRFLFYSPDSWNLDRLYERRFHGRRRKRYRLFTQRMGFVLILLGLLYTWLMVWPILEELFSTKTS